jgi:hypothetical protein
MGDPSRGALPRILAAATIAGVLVTTYAVRAECPDSLASIQVEPADSPALPTRIVGHEIAPPLPDADAAHPVPVVDGVALDERFASLAGWVHPVVGTDRMLAELPMGMFGAERSACRAASAAAVTAASISADRSVVRSSPSLPVSSSTSIAPSTARTGAVDATFASNTMMAC